MHRRQLTDAKCNTIISLYGITMGSNQHTVSVPINVLRNIMRTAFQQGLNADVMQTTAAKEKK